MDYEASKILADEMIDFLNGVETLCVKFRKQIEKLYGLNIKPKATILEDRFSGLRWENEKGAKLGEFQVAYKKHNLADNWQHAFHILMANSSIIANSFYEEGYKFRYWVYPEKYLDRIFRKRLQTNG